MPSDIETDLEIIRGKIQSLREDAFVSQDDAILKMLLYEAESKVEEALKHAKRRN